MTDIVLKTGIVGLIPLRSCRSTGDRPLARLTLMRTLALLLPLVLAPGISASVQPVAQEIAPQKGLTKKQLRTTLAALKTALKAKEPATRIAGLDQAATVVHKDVIAGIGKALHDSTPAVRQHALDLLGKLDHEAALKTLHDFARKGRRKLEDDTEQYALLLKSIARHGSAQSLDYLTDRFWETRDRELVRARILSIANVRDKQAVEALFEAMGKGNRRQLAAHMGEFRLALNVLLAVDQGASQDRWRSWWNTNKKTFQVVDKMPKLPNDSLREWRRFWGLEVLYERSKRRGDRGNDPEGGR